jgi:hypothetical protein
MQSSSLLAVFDLKSVLAVIFVDMLAAMQELSVKHQACRVRKLLHIYMTANIPSSCFFLFQISSSRENHKKQV